MLFVVGPEAWNDCAPECDGLLKLWEGCSARGTGVVLMGAGVLPPRARQSVKPALQEHNIRLSRATWQRSPKQRRAGVFARPPCVRCIRINKQDSQSVR